jgi:hypothetical protein
MDMEKNVLDFIERGIIGPLLIVLESTVVHDRPSAWQFLRHHCTSDRP